MTVEIPRPRRLLYLERFEKFDPESALLADVQHRRGEMVTGIVQNLQQVVRLLQAEGGESYSTRFRMADFADFALKVAPIVGTQEEVRALLERVAAQQIAAANEDDPLRDLIDSWLRDETFVNIDREVTLSQLGAELVNIRPKPWTVAEWAADYGKTYSVRKRRPERDRQMFAHALPILW